MCRVLPSMGGQEKDLVPRGLNPSVPCGSGVLNVDLDRKGAARVRSYAQEAGRCAEFYRQWAAKRDT